MYFFKTCSIKSGLIQLKNIITLNIVQALKRFYSKLKYSLNNSIPTKLFITKRNIWFIYSHKVNFANLFNKIIKLNKGQI